MKRSNRLSPRFRDWSVKTQLTVLSVGITFVLLASSSWYIYIGVLDILQKRSEQSTLQLFRQADASVRSLRSETEKISNLLFMNSGFKELLDGHYQTEAERVGLVVRIEKDFSSILYNYNSVASIFLFTENGELIGADAGGYYYRYGQKEAPFYQSAVYREAKNHFPRLIWTAGNRQTDFIEDPVVSSGDSGYVLSLSRGIKTEYQFAQSGTIVINMKEQSLASIYGNLSESDRSWMYIMDAQGKVISSNRPETLGSGSAAFRSLEPASLNGSFPVQHGSERKQVIYYRIGETDWTLVHEIPFDEFHKDIFHLRKTVLVILLFTVLATFLLSSIWISRLIRPIRGLAQMMRNVEKGQLGMHMDYESGNEVGLLCSQFNRMSDSILELIRTNEAIEEEKRRYEVEALQSQINPHFLHNTLNSVKVMGSMIQATNIVDTITALGNILRSVYQNPGIMCAVREELEFVNHFIKIMNIRYGQGCEIRIEVPDELLDCQTLRFILQPLIENSFFYGMDPVSGALKVTIEGRDLGRDILLIVSDNGAGMSEEKRKKLNDRLNGLSGEEAGGGGIGLVNVNRRIRIHFGDMYGLHVQAGNPGGTDVLIRLPKYKKTENPSINQE